MKTIPSPSFKDPVYLFKPRVQHFLISPTRRQKAAKIRVCIHESLKRKRTQISPMGVKVLGRLISFSFNKNTRSFLLHSDHAFAVSVPNILLHLTPCELLCIRTAGSTCTLWWITAWIAKCSCFLHLFVAGSFSDAWEPIFIQILPNPRWQKWDFAWKEMRLKHPGLWCRCDKCAVRFH